MTIKQLHEIALLSLNPVSMLSPLPTILQLNCVWGKINAETSYIRVLGRLGNKSVTRKYEGGRTTDEGHQYYRAKKRKLLERRKCVFFLKNTFGVNLQVFLEMLLATICRLYEDYHFVGQTVWSSLQKKLKAYSAITKLCPILLSSLATWLAL